MTPVLEIRKLISEDQMDLALEKAQSLPNIEAFSDDLVIITSLHHALKTKIRLQTIPAEQQRVESNRIKASLLELLNEYEMKSQGRTIHQQGVSNEQELLKELLRLLDLSWEAFQVQKRMTESLVNSVKERLHVDTRDVEQFFFNYYAQFNKEELRMHSMIRAYTERIMFPNNTQALEIIQQYGSTYQWREHIPAMELLEEHLIFWKVKYEAAFMFRPAMCVVYLLLEEGKGFPVGVEDEIQEYIDTCLVNI